jgi:hypothetical protein
MGLLDMVSEHGGGVVGQLTKKFGVSADQAKQVLAQAVPFIKDKIGGKLRLPGTGASLFGAIKDGDLAAYARDPSKLDDDDDVRAKAQGLLGDPDDDQEAHVAEVARSTGLDPAVVRQMLPHAAVATVGAMDADGSLEEFNQIHGDLMAKLKALGAIKQDT